jgi:hypothetical protein
MPHSSQYLTLFNTSLFSSSPIETVQTCRGSHRTPDGYARRVRKVVQGIPFFWQAAWKQWGYGVVAWVELASAPT